MNAAERAYQTLRTQAIRFELKPGQRLNEVELARALGMSRAPVREAMNRLVTEELLSFVPNQGFSCRKLSASEIAGLYVVRADLEAGGLPEVMRQADRGALKELARSNEEIIAQAEKLPVDPLVAHDEEFHLKLTALGGNKERVRLLEHINARIQFVRRINLEAAPRRQTSLAEHGAIMAQLLTGELEAAVTILRRHLTLSADEAMNSVRLELARIYAESVA
jgi:DNA-binding GntR family transcriptional regulator